MLNTLLAVIGRRVPELHIALCAELDFHSCHVVEEDRDFSEVMGVVL